MPGCSDDAPLASAVGLPGNFHTLEADKTYRSAQPTAPQLRTAIERLGIKTVVNLRGPNAGKPWYDAEADVCREMNVTLRDHRLSANRLPSAEEIAGVVQTLETLEPQDYPILIHCRGGADRSGMVSALYRIEIQGKSKAEAMAELDLKYLHFNAFTPCMDKFVEIYESGPDWLAEYGDTMDEISCIE